MAEKKFHALTKELQETIRNEYGRDISLEDSELILRDLSEYFLTLAKVCRRIDEDRENSIMKL